MFIKEELFAQLPVLSQEPIPPIEVLAYDNFDFTTASSEQAIQLHRGRKEDYQSCLHFWVSSLRSLGGGDEGLETISADCSPISEQQFFGLIEEYMQGYPGLKQSYVLVPKGRFIAAMQMKNYWAEMIAVAEFDHEYVAFYWCTTA